MLKIAVCVSGGGTNLQAIMDAIDNGTITNAEISVVISNNRNAYALERAKNKNIPAICISPKDYVDRVAFNEDFSKQLDSYQVDLVVLAGFLVVIPQEMIADKLQEHGVYISRPTVTRRCREIIERAQWVANEIRER